MEEKDLIKTFINIKSIDEFEKWNDEIFGPSTDDELDAFWDWADDALFNQIWDALIDRLLANSSNRDEQQIECDKVEFEFVPNAIQQHIIMYFCGNDLACSLILTAPMEIDIEEITYENNLLTFSGIVLDR